VTPETILAWHCKLVASKFDGFHAERPPQGKGHVVLVTLPDQPAERTGPLRCRERGGGLLKYYYGAAA
jgi:putative transposase